LSYGPKPKRIGDFGIRHQPSESVVQTKP